MWDVGANADHVEIEPAKRENIFSQAVIRLAWNANHDAAAGLISKALEQPQQRQAVRPAGSAGRMNCTKQRRV